MPLSSPLPTGLAAESRQAAKIFKSFVDPVNGLDRLIPTDVLRQARGFAILTVVKAGFVFSARAGTGLVIARLPNGSWSAPSAIGTAGAGFGGQVGAELTEFIIVLNSKSAVKSFMSAGSVTLGGNLSIAVGPLGRNAEGSGALNTKGKVAAMYSYSKTKGLFGGVSIEGSVIVERSDANAKAYGPDVNAKQLLSGRVEPPAFCDVLRDAIAHGAGAEIDPTWVDDAPSPTDTSRSRSYSFSSPYAATGNGATGFDERNKTFPRHSSRDDRDPFADDRRSSPTWRGGAAAGSDDEDVKGRASIDTISHERDRYDEDERIWQPQGASNSPKITKKGSGFGTFGKNRSRASSRASATGFNPHFDATLDGDMVQRQFTPPPSKSRLSPFARSRSNSKASDFHVPPEVYARNSPDPSSTPVSTRVAHTFATGTPSRHRKGDSLDVTKDTAMHSDDLINLGGPADSLRRARRNTGTLIDVTDTTRGARKGSPSSNGFKFGDTTARMAQVDLRDPRPKFLSTDTRTASFDRGQGQAIALYDFDGVEVGDLTFKRNDVIMITKRLEGEEWYEGRIGMRSGIFPLNRVEIIE